MKRLIVVAAAVALTSCASAQLTAGKTLAAADEAVAAAAGEVHQAYVAGALSKAQVRVAAGLVDQADDWSHVAACAYAAGDLTTVSGAIADVSSLAASLLAVKNGQSPAGVVAAPSTTCANPAPVSQVKAP